MERPSKPSPSRLLPAKIIKSESSWLFRHNGNSGYLFEFFLILQILREKRS
jgi:hypothetical protein